MKSTISLFHHLCKHLPPLFPSETAEKMRHALEHLEKDQTVTLEQIEQTMINFGYELWPWNQAFREFLVLAENQVGEHFLLPKLTPEMQRKYVDFKNLGGSLRELHSGRPAVFFSSEERVILCEALVDLQHELYDYAARDVSGMSKKKYLQRVEEFFKTLDKIKDKMAELRKLADAESEHPSLAAEIRAQVLAFEYGLCLLGPELRYDAICESPEFFQGRKMDLNRMRGMHLPVNFQL